MSGENKEWKMKDKLGSQSMMANIISAKWMFAEKQNCIFDVFLLQTIFYIKYKNVKYLMQHFMAEKRNKRS